MPGSKKGPAGTDPLGKRLPEWGHFPSKPSPSQDVRDALLTKLRGLREAANAARQRADQTEGQQHEVEYLRLTDLRRQVCLLLDDLRRAA